MNGQVRRRCGRPALSPKAGVDAAQGRNGRHHPAPATTAHTVTPNVYRVFNGYIGFNAVHRVVLASTEQEAIQKVAQATRGKRHWGKDRHYTAEAIKFSHDVETEEYD